MKQTRPDVHWNAIRAFFFIQAVLIVPISIGVGIVHLLVTEVTFENVALGVAKGLAPCFLIGCWLFLPVFISGFQDFLPDWKMRWFSGSAAHLMAGALIYALLWLLFLISDVLGLDLSLKNCLIVSVIAALKYIPIQLLLSLKLRGRDQKQSYLEGRG